MDPIQPLKGFRDFLPKSAYQRNYLKQKLTATVQRFGFQPLETPTLEYASLLLGKYGAEADKLVYQFTDQGDRHVALRYDQTVPTARILMQYNHQLPKFFRRYQTQTVFRAEKPQKGRYREFLQFDLDIFNAPPLSLADAEILACVYAAYQDLGLTDIQIHINHRETLLNTLSPFETENVSVFSIIQTIDKLDKHSPEQIQQELEQKGLSETVTHKLLQKIQQAPIHSEIQQIINQAQQLGVPAQALHYQSTLARGLDYYTGAIFETILPGTRGSLGGGGRYDQLIKQLGGPDIPAVGFAFGFDRTLEALIEKNLIPQQTTNTQLLMTIFNAELNSNSLLATQQLRQAGICVEIYPIPTDQIAKQIKYASQSNIPYIGIIGPEEATNQTITIKNLTSGEQSTMEIAQAVDFLHQSNNQ